MPAEMPHSKTPKSSRTASTQTPIRNGSIPRQPPSPPPSPEPEPLPVPEPVPKSKQSLVITQRVSALPLVACTLQAYHNARREGNLLSLGILCSEVAVGLATLPARAVAAPLATLCPLPLRVGDKLLCFGLDCVEKVAPCIKEPPRKMCRPVRRCYTCTRDTVESIPDMAWILAYDILASPVGRTLMLSTDRLISSAEGCVDCVLPLPDSPDANSIVHFLSTLAHIPTKSARHVFNCMLLIMRNVAEQAGLARINRVFVELARHEHQENHSHASNIKRNVSELNSE